MAKRLQSLLAVTGDVLKDRLGNAYGDDLIIALVWKIVGGDREDAEARIGELVKLNGRSHEI